MPPASCTSDEWQELIAGLEPFVENFKVRVVDANGRFHSERPAIPPRHIAHLMAPSRTLQSSLLTNRPRSASQPSAKSLFSARPVGGRPLALIVFLENVGYINGVKLPRWAMAAIDWATEEYAKLLLRLLGAHRRYDRVIILEDAAATLPI